MPNEILTTAMIPLPAAADGVTIASDGGAATYGTWVELSASAPSDLFIAGLVFSHPAGTNLNTTADIQIGVGAAAAETALATFGIWGRGAGGVDVADSPMGMVKAGIPISGIGSGDRIAARMRLGSAANINFKITGLFLADPISGTLETTANPLLATASVTPVANATPWDNGSWVQVTAATGAAWVINHLVLVHLANGQVEVDIGTGSGGAETVVYTYASRIMAAQSETNVDQLPILFDNIGNGVRVAVRVRSSIANADVVVRLGYYEKPL